MISDPNEAPKGGNNGDGCFWTCILLFAVGSMTLFWLMLKWLKAMGWSDSAPL